MRVFLTNIAFGHTCNKQYWEAAADASAAETTVAQNKPSSLCLVSPLCCVNMRPLRCGLSSARGGTEERLVHVEGSPEP